MPKLYHRIGLVMNPLLLSMILPLPLETNTAIDTPWTLDFYTRFSDTVTSRNQISLGYKYVISAYHIPGNLLSIEV